MPVSKAQQKAVDRYVKANYDRIEFKATKGRKAEIQAHAQAQGESVNAFINRAVSEIIDRESTNKLHKTAEKAQEGEVVSLSPATLKTAQEAAQAAGVATEQFISQAVGEQAKKDILTRLREERQTQTTDALVREINDTARLVTSTLWENVFYNSKLYKKPKDAQKVRAALVECKQHTGETLGKLIETIG